MAYMRKAITFFSLAGTVLSLAACGAQLDTMASAGTRGDSRILLTDAPFPYYRVSRADIYVVSVSLSTSTDTSAGAVGGAFTTVATPNKRINMLALQNGLTELLGTARLPVGSITAVRMVIDTDSSSLTLRSGQVLNGKSTPAIQWQSSAGRPTLNALIHEQILAPDTGAVIVLDFDVGKTFIPPQEVDPASLDSGFIFSPVLHAADGARTGSISGTVRSGTTSGPPVADASLRLYLGALGTPENTWSNLATTKTDANGAFRFSYVTRSSFWARQAAQAGKTYIIAVDPSPFSTLKRTIVPGFSVTERAETSAGVIVLQ